MSSPADSPPNAAPSTLSSCPFLTVRQTPSAGRGIYATQRIPAGTHLHTSATPVAYVINREYQREVCGECFAYDRGVVWKIRDARTGTAWCSTECEAAWRERYTGIDGGVEAIEAMALVERLARKGRTWKNGEQDVVMVDIAGTKPEEQEIERAWRVAEQGVGRLICGYRARGGDGTKENATPIKAARKAVVAVLAAPTTPDILSYLLSAVLTARFSLEAWSELLHLHSAPRAYASHSALHQHILAYHQLLAIVPVSLLTYVRPEIIVAASTRDAHNSFGLRSLDDGGSEIFGFGVWPSASYWNHSCTPNVRKRRAGRGWCFETSEDVDDGQELCITYLGGEEKELEIKERRKRLYDIWGFDCTCSKCTDSIAQD